MKKTFFLFILSIIPLSCISTDLYKNNTGCIKGDCSNGIGTYVFDNGDTYTGEFKNEYINGTGTSKYADGSIYTGQWHRASREGSGVFFFANGDEYDGEFHGNVPNGKGKYTYADGTIEKGIFVDYLFTGQIRLPEAGDNEKIAISKIIDIKPAEFEVSIAKADGIKSGDKLFTEINSTMCTMKVISYIKSGYNCRMIGGSRFLVFQATKDLPVYRIMKGIKRNNNTFLFPNGNKYTGEFKGNLMNGKGEFTWTNGAKYTGEFKNGIRNGNGILKTYAGSIYTGEFKNGYYEGSGKYETSSGTYEGQWKNGRLNGKGKSRLSHNEFMKAEFDTYEGEFKNGLMDGYGTYTHFFGDKYVGEFKKNMMHGKGVLYKSDGTIYQEGRWEFNMYMGK